MYNLDLTLIIHQSQFLPWLEWKCCFCYSPKTQHVLHPVTPAARLSWCFQPNLSNLLFPEASSILTTATKPFNQPLSSLLTPPATTSHFRLKSLEHLGRPKLLWHFSCLSLLLLILCSPGTDRNKGGAGSDTMFLFLLTEERKQCLSRWEDCLRQELFPLFC